MSHWLGLLIVPLYNKDHCALLYRGRVIFFLIWEFFSWTDFFFFNDSVIFIYHNYINIVRLCGLNTDTMKGYNCFIYGCECVYEYNQSIIIKIEERWIPPECWCNWNSCVGIFISILFEAIMEWWRFYNSLP